MNNLLYSDRYFNTDWQIELFSVYFKICFLNFSNICCWYTLELPQWEFQCAPTTYVHSINECFHHKTGFSQTSQLYFMFQCYEQVEMNKFLYGLEYTWMAIIDAKLVVAWLYYRMGRIAYLVIASDLHQKHSNATSHKSRVIRQKSQVKVSSSAPIVKKIPTNRIA